MLAEVENYQLERNWVKKFFRIIG